MSDTTDAINTLVEQLTDPSLTLIEIDKIGAKLKILREMEN